MLYQPSVLAPLFLAVSLVFLGVTLTPAVWRQYAERAGNLRWSMIALHVAGPLFVALALALQLARDPAGWGTGSAIAAILALNTLVISAILSAVAIRKIGQPG